MSRISSVCEGVLMPTDWIVATAHLEKVRHCYKAWSCVAAVGPA